MGIAISATQPQSCTDVVTSISPSHARLTDC